MAIWGLGRPALAGVCWAAAAHPDLSGWYERATAGASRVAHDARSPARVTQERFPEARVRGWSHPQSSKALWARVMDPRGEPFLNLRVPS